MYLNLIRSSRGKAISACTALAFLRVCFHLPTIPLEHRKRKASDGRHPKRVGKRHAKSNVAHECSARRAADCCVEAVPFLWRKDSATHHVDAVVAPVKRPTPPERLTLAAKSLPHRVAAAPRSPPQLPPTIHPCSNQASAQGTLVKGTTPRALGTTVLLSSSVFFLNLFFLENDTHTNLKKRRRLDKWCQIV